MKTITELVILCFVLMATSSLASEGQIPLIKANVTGVGRAIMLIPGFTSDSRVWDDIADDLAQHYQVHNMSLAGFGKTPPHSTPSLENTKAALLDYIRTENLHQPIIIGHSLGGFMGLWLEISAPDSIGPVVSVDGLPFIGPLFSRDPSVTVEQLKPQAEYLKAFYTGLDAQGMVGAAARSIHIQAANKADQETILTMSRLSDPATAADAIYTLMSTDLRPELAKVNSQVLLLGASGGFLDENGKKAAASLYESQMAGLKKARIVMNESSRHFIMYDDPQWLVEQLNQFLREAK